MAHYNFKKDLAAALAVEQEVMELLKQKVDGISNLQQWSGKAYDISANFKNRKITFEVKHDLMATQTGNVAVEYACRGKDSGLTTTLADYWIYKIGVEFFVFRASVLRKKLFKEKAYFRLVTGGDKGSNTKMFLVKLVVFKQWGKKL